MLTISVIVLLTSAAASASASAAETQTYTYDAKGRLVQVVRSGTASPGTTTEIAHDRARNPVRLKVTGW